MAVVPRWELRKGRISRQWRFVLVARNSQVIATSETYKRKIDAVTAIEAIQAAAHAPICG